MFDSTRAGSVLRRFVDLGLVSRAELAGLEAILGASSPIAHALELATSVHVHVRVEDVDRLPLPALRDAGASVEREQIGYTKYAFAGGLNLICSAIDVAEDDRLAGFRKKRPHVDHVGIDLRQIDEHTRAAFDALPSVATTLGWRHVAQGGGGQPVACCHASVDEKHWLYPNKTDAFPRPIEIALGPLVLSDAEAGVDLRPIDPAHPLAATLKTPLTECC